MLAEWVVVDVEEHLCGLFQTGLHLHHTVHIRNTSLSRGLSLKMHHHLCSPFLPRLFPYTAFALVLLPRCSFYPTENGNPRTQVRGMYTIHIYRRSLFSIRKASITTLKRAVREQRGRNEGVKTSTREQHGSKEEARRDRPVLG